MRSTVGRWVCAFSLVAAAVTAVSPSVAEAEDVEQLPAAGEAKPALTSISPERFADTRPGSSTIDGAFAGAGRRAASSVYKVQIAGRGSVPAGARGAMINIAAVNPGGPGFFTAYPCGPRPNASALNYTTGVDIANEVLSELSNDGSVCVFTLAQSDLLIDVVGYTTTSDSMKTLKPKRFGESREGLTTFDGESQGFGRTAAGSTTKIRIAGRGGVPADAAAAVINVAVVDPDLAGFITVHACLPSRPLASSINHTAGVNRANELVAQVDAAGDICVYTQQSIDLIVDVVGFVQAGSDLVSTANARFAETRNGQSTFDGVNQGGGKLPAATTRQVQIAGRGTVPADAVAVVANIAAVEPNGSGFFTVYPCNQARPLASSINYVAGVNGANEIIARLDGAGKLCVYTSTNSHFILDVVGYVKPNADVSITKNDNVSAVIVGETITYTVEAINNGPDTAADVSVADVLPGNVTFTTTNGCAEDPAGVPTCTLGDITAGQSESFTVSATINKGRLGNASPTRRRRAPAPPTRTWPTTRSRRSRASMSCLRC